MTRNDRPVTGCIVLAAGSSRRMGRDKLMAELAGKPVIAHVLERVCGAGLGQPIVVVPEADGDLARAVLRHDVKLVAAPDCRSGLAHSLREGIRQVPADWDAVIVCLGDMPLVSPELLRLMASEARVDGITVPRHDGRRGNPVLWGRAHFAKLQSLNGDRGGSQIIGAELHHVHWIDWPDASIHSDIDTMADLERIGRSAMSGRPLDDTDRQ